MNDITITSAQYYKDEIRNVTSGIKAVIDGETLSVPLDPDNRHYAAILEWVADGNTIQDAD